MNATELLSLVSERLGEIFERNSLTIREKSFDSARGRAAILWASDKLLVEIYSDPQGGEVNCRVASLASGLVEPQWRFLYELVPLSADELRAAHMSFRSEAEQFDTLTRKLMTLLAQAPSA